MQKHATLTLCSVLAKLGFNFLKQRKEKLKLCFADTLS
jgi:hypothetical protein